MLPPASPAWPDRIDSEDTLDEVLSRPSPALVEYSRALSSPLLILGAGGKMGPTLAVLARRAAEMAGHTLDILAVSRFGDPRVRTWLEARGVGTRSCDLLTAHALDDLPDTRNILYLAGLKFGTSQNPSATWAMNTLAPTRVMERFPHARIAALSTGNVYPLGDVSRGGSIETAPTTPLGEYANAAVARERIFEFHSRAQGTPVTLLRLFYAVELRYGVIADIARNVHGGEPIQLANGFFNCIWQGDANELSLRALTLADSPPSIWNLCMPQVFSVRSVAMQLGELLQREPHFEGSETPTALLGNAARLCDALGPPAMPVDTILHWTAHWVKQGGRNLGRPTHFEVRDGQY